MEIPSVIRLPEYVRGGYAGDTIHKGLGIVIIVHKDSVFSRRAQNFRPKIYQHSLHSPKSPEGPAAAPHPPAGSDAAVPVGHPAARPARIYLHRRAACTIFAATGRHRRTTAPESAPNMNHDLLLPLLLTLGAGLATGIGSALAFLARHTNKRLLSFSLGLSGGVMIYVSFVELLRQADTTLAAEWGARNASLICAASFFAGILLIGIIDRLVPSFENPHEARAVEELNDAPRNPRLMRMGLLTALAIGIHNFPEGIATFAAAMDDTALGVAIAVAIAIHNIPEGIAVSIPIYYATGNRRKAFLLSLLSGLAEPVGAVLAWALLAPFMSPTLMGCLLAGVAGIMVFISIDELLPAAREYGEAHTSIYGVVAGMAVMAASLILLA